MTGLFMLTFLIFITYKPDDFKPDPDRSGTGGVSLGRLWGMVQFLGALIVGATYRLWTLVKAIGSEVLGIWWALKAKQYVGDELKEKRIEACQKCPLFYKPLQTCGSPLAKDPSKGCHCYVPIMAGAYHDCWKWERDLYDLEYQWPNELNSTWIENDK